MSPTATATARRPRRFAWPRGALRTRAGLAMGLVSLILAASLAVLAYSLVRSSLLADRESAALRQAYTNARVVRGALRAADPDLPGLLAGLQVGTGGGAVVVTPAGTSTSSVEVADTDLPPSLVDAVADGSAGRQRVDSPGGPRLVIGVPIAASDAAYYELTSLREVDRTLEVLASSLAIAAAVATAVGATLGVFVSGAVLRPLRGAADAARRIVDGDLDTRLETERDRDLAPLADAFNEMLDDLRERIRREVRFASDVTHELRGPLTVLAAAVNVVERRRAQLPPEAVEAVDALDSQVTSFNRLVLDLLEISRFDAGRASLDTRPVDLADFVHALVEARPQPRPTVELVVPPPFLVELDARRIHQVLTNLLDNADNYAGGASRVVVDAPRPGRARVAVEDDGPGIAADERVTVFGRFARGAASERPDAARGSGLGLALCADHVRLHGGTIGIEDAESGGARFVVELPERPR